MCATNKLLSTCAAIRIRRTYVNTWYPIQYETHRNTVAGNNFKDFWMNVYYNLITYTNTYMLHVASYHFYFFFIIYLHFAIEFRKKFSYVRQRLNQGSPMFVGIHQRAHNWRQHSPFYRKSTFHTRDQHWIFKTMSSIESCS